MASASSTLGSCNRGGATLRGELTDGAVVVTMTIKDAPGVTAVGVTVQLAAIGTPPQLRVTDWLNPDSPLTTNP
jgi:hypothetical protein